MRIFVNGTVFILVGLDIFYKMRWREIRIQLLLSGRIDEFFETFWIERVLIIRIVGFSAIKILCLLLYPIVACAFKLSDKIKQIGSEVFKR